MHTECFFSCLIIITASVPCPAAPPPHNTVTAALSMGYGAPSHKVGNASQAQFDVTALRWSLGMKRQNHELRLAYTSLSFVGFFGGGRARNSELALLYGYRIAQGEHGYICPSAGIARAQVHRSVTVLYGNQYATWRGEVDRSHNLAGLAVSVRGVWLLTRHFGFGAEWFADFNAKNSFNGLLFSLNVGP